MRTFKICVLLALIPTLTFALENFRDQLHGIWIDHYTNTELEIRETRKGIKVKHHGGWLRKWRTYVPLGRGVFDDCDGRAIVVLSRNRIEWRRGRNARPILLQRLRDYGRSGRGYQYDRNRDRLRDYGYNNSRDYDRYRSSNRNRSSSYRDGFCGDWYCDQRGLSLTIQAYGNGFRARSGNDWTYYEPYQDHFRDRKGNKYYLNDRSLTWHSRNNKRKLNFRRR